MVQQAERISNGNFSVIKVEGNDEMTRLAVSLNKMSGNLEQTIQELEKRNAELDKFLWRVNYLI